MLEILLLKNGEKIQFYFYPSDKNQPTLKKIFTLSCVQDINCTIDSDMHVDLQNPFKYQTSYYKIYDIYRKEIWPSRCTISLIVKIWHPDILITTSVSAGGQPLSKFTMRSLNHPISHLLG